MGAGGSHPQALSDSEEGERGTRTVRWADCKAEEGKEEEEQETAVEREEDAEREKETGQVKMASEKPPGLKQREESEHEERGEESAGVARVGVRVRRSEKDKRERRRLRRSEERKKEKLRPRGGTKKEEK